MHKAKRKKAGLRTSKQLQKMATNKKRKLDSNANPTQSSMEILKVRRAYGDDADLEK